MLFELTKFQPENYLTFYDNLEFFIRILLSCALGFMIGYERTTRIKGAGIRTHCITAGAAAGLMILPKYRFLGRGSGEPARIAAQVVSGVSFLGAGVMFNQGGISIKGLTTAAGIWATAAVGMSIGAGMYWVGVFEAIAVASVQWLLHRFAFGVDALSMQKIAVSMRDDPELMKALAQKHAGISQISV